MLLNVAAPYLITFFDGDNYSHTLSNKSIKLSPIFTNNEKKKSKKDEQQDGMVTQNLVYCFKLKSGDHTL